MMVHHGTVDWFSAAMARTPWRMVAEFSASSPIRKPGQSQDRPPADGRSRQVDEAHHLLAGVGRPRAGVVIRVARQQRTGAAVETREAGDDRAAEIRPISKNEPLSTTDSMIGRIL